MDKKEPSKLSFEGLFDLPAAQDAPQRATMSDNAQTGQGQYRSAPEEETPAERKIEGLQRTYAPAPAQDLIKAKQKEKEDAARAREILRKYQDNTLLVSQLQREILEGVKAGASAEDLLLKAATAIGLLVDDQIFAKIVEREWKAKHPPRPIRRTPPPQ